MQEVPYNPNSIRQRINGIDNPDTTQYRLQKLDSLNTNVSIPGTVTTDYTHRPFDLSRQKNDPRLPVEPPLFGWVTPDRSALERQTLRLNSIPELTIATSGIGRIIQKRLQRTVKKATVLDKRIRTIEFAAESIARPSAGWPDHYTYSNSLRPATRIERRKAKILDRYAHKARRSMQSTNRMEAQINDLPPATFSSSEKTHIKKMRSSVALRKIREDRIYGTKFLKTANTDKDVKKYDKLSARAIKLRTKI